MLDPAWGITVSVVSHGNLQEVQALVGEIARQNEIGAVRHVVVTHNLSSSPVRCSGEELPFELTEIHNSQQKGFAANHNQAFALCETALFCVANPDVDRLAAGFWPGLIDALRRPEVGCAYPVLLNPDGSRQDNERELPTLWALLRRRVGLMRCRRTDWVSASFWLLPASLFRELGGLDTRYRMYCEDVEFCLRLQLAGYRLERAEVCATHAAKRGSHRQPVLLYWHVASLLKLWGSRTFWRYLTGSGMLPERRY